MVSFIAFFLFNSQYLCGTNPIIGSWFTLPNNAKKNICEAELIILALFVLVELEITQRNA